MHSIWDPILNQLEKNTGLKFVLQGSSNIPDFEKDLIAGKYDFAYMNPYHQAVSHHNQGYKSLIRDHGKMLHGILVVRKDGPISDVKQLDGKVLAFPAPNALGASLMMRAELKNKFNINITPRYVKTHDSVYLNVILKQVAAGGGIQKTLNKQKAGINNKLKVLHRTQKVAPHPFSYHPRVNKDIAKKVQQAFINMGKTEFGKKLLQEIPIKKIGIATLEEYSPILEMGLEKFISVSN